MNRLLQLLSCNILLKVTSLLIAFILWNICLHFAIIEKTIPVPICIYNADPHTSFNAPDTIQITLQGNQSIMRTIEDKSIVTQINANQCTNPINWISINESTISMPYGVHIVHCYPSTLTITKQT